MDENSCVIYLGEKFTLEWYYDKNGESVAYDYFMKSTEELQGRFLFLVKKMGDFGKIYDITKFRNEGDGIYAFKPQPDRYWTCLITRLVIKQVPQNTMYFVIF